MFRCAKSYAIPARNVCAIEYFSMTMNPQENIRCKKTADLLSKRSNIHI